jgi:hypothetical protein
MACYIEGKSKLKTKANNDFEKDFFKLMDNADVGENHAER